MNANFPLLIRPRSRFQYEVANPSIAKPLMLWLRKPVFIALMLGCGVSLLATAGLRIGLVLSMALTWSFVPAAELIALVCVAGGTTKLARAQRVDLFFAAHTPWLIWVAVLGMLGAFLPINEMFFTVITWALVSGAIVLLWLLWIDFHFFRVVCGASRKNSLARLAVQRLISWTLIVAVFAYGSFWPSVIEEVSR